MPRYEDLNWTGWKSSRRPVRRLARVDCRGLERRLASHDELFRQAWQGLPDALECDVAVCTRSSPRKARAAGSEAIRE